jgi:hypothetical protein
MTSYYFTKLVGGYTICFALLIGIIRFHRILEGYKPFIYFLIIAFLNEVMSQVLSKALGSNAIGSNIYVLIEFLILLLLFRNWGYHTRKDRFYIIIGVIVSAIWILDSVIFHPLTKFNSIYRIVYSFVLIFLSIDEINFIIVSERRNVLKNSRFIICSVFIFFFSYKALVETFFLIEAPFSNDFYRHLVVISTFINLLANLTFILATSWMPTKQRFLLPYQ